MFNKRSFLAIVVSIIVVGTSTYSFLLYLDRKEYRNYLQAQYQRSLYDLISNVDGIQVSLSKAQVTATPKQALILFGDIWRQASIAQDKLNSLPISHQAIGQTTKFLTQVGDFCYSLLKTVNSGQSLTEADMNTVEKLTDFAGYLNVQLHELEREISAGNIDWTEIKDQGSSTFNRNLAETVDVKFERIAKELQEYPTLIYDGPFAENVLNIKPRVLKEKEVSLDEAKKIAADIIGKERVASISQYSDKTSDKVPTYALSVKVRGRKDGDINIDISKNGGHLVYMLDSRSVGKETIKIKKAVDIGIKFLEKHGYKSMIPTYALKYDNVAVINYVYVQDKVVIYPDQIKLKIALDNGDIVGIEAQHYMIAHTKRDIQKPRISVDEARSNVSTKLAIKNVRLSIIPMESMKEVFCYEFYGEYKGEKYIVYINAMDGTEERILKLIDTPNGELTM
ncbi:Sporulation protein YpeB [Caloramator mitchellensis]|uniref:Sporulation protein YpeB n=1 Tax=Caloramator mitchellensis TaxID=908809 RepID=A0A0R3JXI6_CALMK|nr:germination protein YpeB [Caloramator mitchellensis]KRQ87770.1 Sporulation protein YpeB [Caloramator mitchellensis]